MSAKASILQSHTDAGLDSARTERTVFTERTADLPPDERPATLAHPHERNPAPDALTRAGVDRDLHGPDSDLAPAAPSTEQSGTPSAYDESGGESLEAVLEWNVPNVQAYMDDHPDDVEAIKQLEAAAEHPRKGVLEHTPPTGDDD